MNSLTIGTAFRLRNKMKKRIKELTGLLRQADVVKDAGAAEITAVFDGLTCAETIAKVERLMDLLCALNLAIERANVVNKEDLIALETLKVKLVVFSDIAYKCREADTFRFENNTEGGQNKIAMEPIVDQAAILAKLEAFNKAVDEIENRLMERNFRTPVDFDAAEARALLL